jgi:hypothetical protein
MQNNNELVEIICQRLSAPVAVDDNLDDVIDAFFDKLGVIAVGDISKLAEVLKTRINTEKNQSRRASFVWMLGKLTLPEAKDFLDQLLAETTDGDGVLLWNTMVALAAINMDIFGDTGGGSVIDVEINRSLAMDYLKRHLKQ